MATAPLLLRRVRFADIPDPDWAATQATPPAAIIADVSGVEKMGVVCVARDALGAVVPGVTLNVQLVDIAVTLEREGVTPTTVIKSGEVDSLVPTGSGLAYDVGGSSRVTMRVLAAAGGPPDHVDIYWNALG